MRFEALHLERYGAFESRTLDLSGPGLIVIHGPNEAGKSTSLNAIGDFLYGIPHNSALGVFGYEAMRVGATLSTSAGGRLSLQRRKGRGKTLIDEAGVGHEDSLLAGLLGATDRDRFSQLFGLDHDTLRTGGARLLAADGEIGRLIVEAGGGLRHLMARMDDLDAEADTLFDTRKRADRAFYQGLDAFTEAEARLRETSLSREEYEAARKARDQAESRLDSLRAEQKAQVADLSRLERLIRVAPLLGQLGSVETDLAAFGDLGALAAGFHARWAPAEREQLDAEDRVGQARKARDQLAARIEKLVADPRVAGAKLDLQDLSDRIVIITTQRRDRPNRKRELADEEAKLALLRERLKAADAKALAARIPPEDAVETVQALALEAIGRRGQRAQAEARIAEAQDTVATLTAAIAMAADAGHDRTWGVEASAFANLAAQSAAGALRARQIETARAALARDVTALGFSDLNALANLACPDPSTIQAEATARSQQEAEQTRQIAAFAAAQAARDGAHAEIERLQQGGPVATQEALGEARSARAAAWAPIQEAYLSWTKRPDAQRAEDVDSLATRLTEADNIADRRATEAQRIAALAGAAQRRADAQAAMDAAQGSQTQLAQALDARRVAFSAAFPDAAARHPELPALAAFVDTRSALLSRALEVDEEASELERQQTDLQPTLDLLTATEALARLAPDAATPLAARVQAVVAAITAHDRAATELARRRGELERAETSLRAQQRELEQLAVSETAWAEAWAGPLAQLGASPDIALEAAAALANQWASARGVLSTIATTQRRIERMDEDEAELTARVARVAVALGISVSDDGPEAASALIAHGRAQNEVNAERAALEPELEQLQTRLDTTEETLNQAREAQARLAREAGLAEADPVGLSAIADRSQIRDDLALARTGLLNQIRSAGDGADLADLRAQLGARDADTLKGELAEVKSRLAEVEVESEVAIREAQAARLQLAGYESGDDANRFLADRETATARMHSALERYVEIRLARDLVAGAIARVRASQQAPLVRRAGELFAAMTQGRFSGVEADVDDKGAPVVVGRRTGGGGTVPVSALSEGSRDQLFLAFRLASVEVYCGATEPLPFVADDILVHFDDARSVATLDLLSEFASTTQVLLFTHHESVRDAAIRMGAGRATVVELG